MLGDARRMPERECCAVEVASFVENQFTERQFTIALRAVKIVDHLISPPGRCPYDLENRAAQLGRTATSALYPGGSVEAAIRANDQPGIRISRWLSKEIV